MSRKDNHNIISETLVRKKKIWKDHMSQEHIDSGTSLVVPG